MTEPMTRLTETISSSLESFENVSINLDRLFQKEAIDPKEYAEARMLINTATMSAIHVQRLAQSPELDVEQQDVIIEQVQLIQETMDYCREVKLLC